MIIRSDTSHPIPLESWILRDWFTAAGVRRDKEIAECAAWLLISDSASTWDIRRINAMKNKRGGVTDRDLGLKYIVILRELARRNHIQLFSDMQIEEHATTFLISAACCEKYAPLSNQELRDIIKKTGSDGYHHTDSTLSSLRSLVQPAPPLYLFGREADLKQIKQAFDRHPVVLIDGIAGEGKTALAWHSAVDGWQSGRFTAFDWTTDKRYIVDAYGKLIPIKEQKDQDSFLYSLLTSLCRQFKWTDLLAADECVLVNRCADRLRRGRYLIIVDNLESIEDSEMIVRQLLDMLSPIGREEPLSSRALVTSRQRVAHPHIKQVSIGGIDGVAREPYLRSLEEAWDVQHPMSAAQCAQLATLTDGNPLFMQIAMRRYAIAPAQVDQIFADIAQGKHRAFDTLFAPLIERFSPRMRVLAIRLAYELSVTEGFFGYDDLLAIWEMDGGDQDAFMDALDELLNHRIVSISGNDGYTMHALIRSFLINLDRGDGSLV